MHRHLTALALTLLGLAALASCEKSTETAAKPTTTKDEPKKDEPKKDEPKKDEPKKDEAGGEAAKLGALSKETCEKVCRKWNIECAVKGAPEPKDPEGMIKMCVSACEMATSTPSMKDAAIVSHAQAACLDKKDCKEFKECVSDKERELKGK